MILNQRRPLHRSFHVTYLCRSVKMAEEGECAVLYYFEARSLAEVIRLMLAAAGITVNLYI